MARKRFTDKDRARISAYLSTIDGGEIVQRLRRGVPCSGEYPTADDIDAADETMADAAARITADAATIAELRAKVEAQSKALAPFGTAANAYDPVEGDDDCTAFDHQFSIGQLRAARAAIKGESRDA